MQGLYGYLRDGETRYVEFKEKYTKSILKSITAFANYHDGRILVGIADSGLITGVENTKETRLSIENAINDNVRPRPDYEIIEEIIEYKRVICIQVYKGLHTPYIFDGKAYKRSDTSTVPVEKHEYDELVLYGRNLSFEELEYSAQVLEFTKLKGILARKINLSEMDSNVLKSLELIKDNKYTNAAALLADQNAFAGVGVDFVVYADDSMMAIKDRISLSCVSVLEHFDTAMLFFRKHINQGEVINGAYRELAPEVPEVAFREAVANAIIHRDYSRNGNNRIEFFNDRIEITSIGGLPIGISKEEYINGNFSNSRNRIIADVFLRCRIIEKMGTGIRRIKFSYAQHREKPTFRVFDNTIQIILPKINAQNLDVQENLPLNSSNEEEKLYNYIKASYGVTRSEVEAFMGIKKTKATGLINRLAEQNAIYKTGLGKSTIYKARTGQ